ncbi:hypothetical protein THRCLA_04161, partial [Thraustotheca clavata]
MLKRSLSVLHLNGSLSQDSVTSVVAKGLITCLAQQIALNDSNVNVAITERDLWHPELPRFCRDTMNSSYRLLLGQGTQKDDEMVAPIRVLTDELLSADCIVISSPVWNHSVPFVLKQYMDCVVQPNLTYCNTTQKPFVQGRSVVLVTSAGGAGNNLPEHETTFGLVKAVFSRVGFDKSHVITIEGLKSPELREERVNLALTEAQDIATSILETSR